MIRQIAVAASVALLGISGQAMAGQPVQLSNVSGSVLVNQNGRYVPVTSKTSLRAGDRILAMDGGANLVYANGCKVALSASSMTTIADAPCAADGVVRAGAATDPNANAAMLGFGSRDGNNDGGDLAVFVIWALIVLGVTAAAFSNDTKPTSP